MQFVTFVVVVVVGTFIKHTHFYWMTSGYREIVWVCMLSSSQLKLLYLLLGMEFGDRVDGHDSCESSNFNMITKTRARTIFERKL